MSVGFCFWLAQPDFEQNLTGLGFMPQSRSQTARSPIFRVGPGTGFSLVPRLPRSGTQTLKLCRRYIFAFQESLGTRLDGLTARGRGRVGSGHEVGV